MISGKLGRLPYIRIPTLNILDTTQIRKIIDTIKIRIDPATSINGGFEILIRPNIIIGEKKGIIDIVVISVLSGFLTSTPSIINGTIKNIITGKISC